MADNNQRDYELVYIAVPELDEDTLKVINDRLIDVVRAQGGEMEGIDLWGRRRLAYPINNHFEGYYALHHFQMPPSGVGEIDRALRFDDNVIRYLLMLRDD